MIRRWLPALVATIAFTLPAAIGAQSALDRKKIPPPGKTPELRVPSWTRATLANGAELIVSEKHDLPLVSFTVTFLGGSNQFEPADRTGLASLAASMLSEGTKTRDGEALSNALQLLGTSVSTSSVFTFASDLIVARARSRSPSTTDWVACWIISSTSPAIRRSLSLSSRSSASYARSVCNAAMARS